VKKRSRLERCELQLITDDGVVGQDYPEPSKGPNANKIALEHHEAEIAMQPASQALLWVLHARYLE